MKRLAAERAIEYIEDGMKVGIGSGSTVKVFIDELKDSGIDVLCIPTSVDTEMELRKCGLRVTSICDVGRIDIAVDGADSILRDKGVILKGGGGALTREKIVDYEAEKLIIIADESKLNRIFPVVIEVIPYAYCSVMRALARYGKPKLRIAKEVLGPARTDNGNWLIDLHMDMDRMNRNLEFELNMIPGVVENGIFSRPARIIVGMSSGEIEEIDIQ